jgi:hypothetical protein
MNGEEFEKFDVTGEGFEAFDVTAEPEPEAEVSIEALGGLSESEDELRSVSQARDELEKRLMLDPGEAAFAAAEEGAAGYGNVVGVGMGEKEVNGSPTGQLVVKVYVKEKLASKDVASEALVPESIGSAKTDVEATGEIAGQLFIQKLRPAPGGVSIGNCNRILAGTLGCLVTRSNKLFILSNNHVMALVNTSPLNAGIPQPGRLDGGVCPADIIARLTQFIPISFAPNASNVVDAAIAQTSPNLVDRRILRPGGVRQRLKSPIVPPALNQLVQKSGRTTQFRRGIIDAINVTVNINYAPIGGVARFVNQFRVKGIGGIFSDRGDSGSLVTTSPQNNPVGLLFAGNAASNTTFCNNIRNVLAAFAVSIVF